MFQLLYLQNQNLTSKQCPICYLKNAPGKYVNYLDNIQYIIEHKKVPAGYIAREIRTLCTWNTHNKMQTVDYKSQHLAGHSMNKQR